MRYRLHLSAWDIMGNVHVAASLFDDQLEVKEHREPVWEATVEVRGVGESEPHEWIRDALVALLEEA